MKKKILIVSILKANITIGGMSSRFIVLWDYLNSKYPNQIYLVSTKSLWDKLIDKPKPKNVFLINDNNSFMYYLFTILISPFLIIFCFVKKISNIHLASVGYQHIPLMIYSKFFKPKCSLTFASRSIEMASYRNKKVAKKWNTVLKYSSYVDVLNPTNTLPIYNYKKFVSICSFPHILYTQKANEINYLATKKENIIVFAGSLSITKNPILAINGFNLFLSKCEPEYKDTKLIMFGKGPLENEIKKIINGNPNIFFMDYNDCFMTLKKSKIFLSLQDFDNYPSQVAMEAMLFRNSIIATSDGDTSKLIKESFGNILIKDKNILELSDAISLLIKNNSNNEENRNFILKEHTIEKFSHYFLSMINSIN
jgi:glycosyltransferase involved in cell wall biosynthesis